MLGLIAGVMLASAGPQAQRSTQGPTQGPAELQKAFTHTIVSTYPDGRIARLWMKPDGSYVSQGRRHEYNHGTWKLKGDQVCFHRMVFSYCTPIPSETAFTTKAVTGERIQVRLTPGRDGEHGGG
jgi:hypothetical protein